MAAARETMDRTAKVRLGSLLLGAGAGGFITAAVLHQILRWRALADGTDADDGAAQDLWAISLVGGFVRLGFWVTVVIGIGLLWSASSQGGRRLQGRAIAGWALVGWGATAATLGVLGLIVDRDEHVGFEIALVALGAVMVVIGWSTQRGRSLEPGPMEQRPPRDAAR
jgi:uncharacterized membrane protein